LVPLLFVIKNAPSSPGSLFSFSVALLLIVNPNDWHLVGMVDPIGTTLGAASLAIQLLDGAVKGWLQQFSFAYFGNHWLGRLRQN
jgi:hypothetical protein